jgi:hypothetical protein
MPTAANHRHDHEGADVVSADTGQESAQTARRDERAANAERESDRQQRAVLAGVLQPTTNARGASGRGGSPWLA